MYAGYQSFAGSTSPAVTELVSPDGAALVLTSSIDPSSFGAILGAVSVDGAGVATYATAALGGGVHAISVAYGGDSYHASAVGALGQTVNVAVSTTALASSSAPSVAGPLVTLTATVSSAAAGARGGEPDRRAVGKERDPDRIDRRLRWRDRPRPRRHRFVRQDELALAALATGTHTLTAWYSGDETYAAGIGTRVHVVNKATTTTMLVSVLDPSAPGADVRLAITVARALATGQVSLFDGTTLLGAAPLAAGIASFSTATLTAGGHAITASYAGDADFAPSASTALVLAVSMPTQADAGPAAEGPATTPDRGTASSCQMQPAPLSLHVATAAVALVGIALIIARRRGRRSPEDAARDLDVEGRGAAAAPRAS